MDGPSVLLKSLSPLFDLEAMRHDKYVFAPVQKLKKCLENYHPKQNNTFVALLEAIVASKPYIEKWRINFEDIKECMSIMAKRHAMDIDWDLLLKDHKDSPRFQFGAMVSDEELIDWLETKLGKYFANLDAAEKTQILIQHIDHSGFSKKLRDHLEVDPDFLFSLIKYSDQNFIQICGSRLNLYITDLQMADAILVHTQKWVTNNPNDFTSIENYINKLNDMLSNGRSVTTLLRNGEAKSILDTSDIFKKYQSDEYKNRHEVESQYATEEGEVKDRFEP